jgi:hypothetical protein
MSAPAQGNVQSYTKLTQQTQTDLKNWIKTDGGNFRDSDLSDDCSYEDEDVNCLVLNGQSHCNTVQDRKIVTDGIHRCDTTNTCVLVK